MLSSLRVLSSSLLFPSSPVVPSSASAPPPPPSSLHSPPPRQVKRAERDESKHNDQLRGDMWASHKEDKADMVPLILEDLDHLANLSYRAEFKSLNLQDRWGLVWSLAGNSLALCLLESLLISFVELKMEASIAQSSEV
ncbi:hypothetical protein FCM35_KLT08642 [Carex littledalei]|uniref:Uncharacterized protein n=1 Tax=Carex littledalei TaxID=544730 RepID=A0A833QU32_9POAL|nr:hypothetical protein FCM35_KLT08642 [Carex littledalei]